MAPRTAAPPARERVLDAADRLLGRFGYAKTTIEDIAREAGLARRTVYLHFASKEELFLASIDRVVERMLEELRALAARDESAEERLRRMLELRVLARFDRVREYHQSLDEIFAALRPAYLARRERYFEDEARILAQVLEEARASGAAIVVDTRETARALVLATNGLLPYSLNARELGSRKVLEREVRSVADLALHGLFPRTARPGSRGPAIS